MHPVPQAESDEARRRAWDFGLISDGDAEWARRAAQLAAYVDAHGDAHVGFRSSDDAELARWAAKQRGDWAAGMLAPHRQDTPGSSWVPSWMLRTLRK